MISEIQASTIGCVKNPIFRTYAQTYLDIARDFEHAVESFGLPFSHEPCLRLDDRSVQRSLEERGITVANGGKSFSTGWLSPSCLTCRRGMGTATFLTSTQCPRRCFFCFNPNQEDYEHYLHHTHDLIAELDDLHQRGMQCRDLALTGGEPLLHPREVLAFFEHAAQLYPDAYTRLYTSGTGLNEALLAKLRAAGLREIRFSIKGDDTPAERAETLHLIEASTALLETVMVEMPVMPDDQAFMKELLVDLDHIGVAGINLLELCFPLNNAPEFAQRGYRIKNRPYRVLYDYWYAGGLPIAGSEEACIDLLAFALDKHLKLGAHYCSLENKLTGQVYQQNGPLATAFPQCTMSEQDYFLKTAKAFGGDAHTVRDFFTHAGKDLQVCNQQDAYLAFPVAWVADLAASLPALKLGISYNVAEQREGDTRLRELRIDATTPAEFDAATDV